MPFPFVIIADVHDHRNREIHTIQRMSIELAVVRPTLGGQTCGIAVVRRRDPISKCGDPTIVAVVVAGVARLGAVAAVVGAFMPQKELG